MQNPLLWNRSAGAKAVRPSQMRLMLAATGVVLLVVLLLVVASRDTETYDKCDADARTVFDVVMDAGSTGSRVHIFQFERTDSELLLEREFFHRTKPGLSSFADDPDGAVASIKELLDVAMASVPRPLQRCTSVTLKATAGLRLLPHEKSQRILDRVEHFIEAKTPFLNRGVSVISGNEEGVYGWLTVNYLFGRLYQANDPSVAIMDMGGASTQIVFETDEEDGEWVPYNYVSRLRVNERRITLYHHSYLGFGLNEARRRVYASVASRNSGSTFPCFPAGFSVTADGGAVIKGGSAPGMQGFAECQRSIISALMPSHHSSAGGAASASGAESPKRVCEFRRCGIEGVPQPKLLSQDHQILAFSYFFDRLEPFLAKIGDRVQVDTLKSVGFDICGSPTHPENKETMCLDFAYLYTYLHDGLRLPDDTPLLVREDINGKSVSWSLGASLMYLLRADA